MIERQLNTVFVSSVSPSFFICFGDVFSVVVGGRRNSLNMGDDSSPDLSLKLRRGSSDSRDSFYMDFDKGIDSDLDEIATTSGADHADSTTADKTATPTVLGQARIDGARWVR